MEWIILDANLFLLKNILLMLDAHIVWIFLFVLNANIVLLDLVGDIGTLVHLLEHAEIRYFFIVVEINSRVIMENWCRLNRNVHHHLRLCR